MLKHCQLEIKNNLAELQRLQSMLESFFIQMQLPQDLGGEMLLVAEELLANTISYGYPDNTESHIDIELTLDQRKLSITLSDDAQPFNPLSKVSPPMGLNSDEADVGGLGIPLIRALSDSQEYRHIDGRNIFSFSKIVISS